MACPFVLCIFTAMGWVTIKTYNFGHEAAIAQHLLENEGIETHLMDELSIQMNPLSSQALGGVKLQVWEEDAERAIKLLQECNMQQVAETTVSGATNLAEDTEEQISNQKKQQNLGHSKEINNVYCPKCGSDNVSKPRLNTATAAISILLLNFPLFPFNSNDILCYDCGNIFKMPH